METNDNLSQKADGKNTNIPSQDQNNDQKDATHENAIIEESNSPQEDSIIKVDPSTEESIQEGTNKRDDQAAVNDKDTVHEDAIIKESKETENEETPNPIDKVQVGDQANSGEETEDDNDEELIDDVVSEKKSPDSKDYMVMSIEQLTKELRNLMQEYPIHKIKEPVKNIEKAFEAQDRKKELELKAAFQKAQLSLPEEERTTEIVYDNNASKVFKELHGLYRKQRGEHQRLLRQEKENNLKNRQTISKFVCSSNNFVMKIQVSLKILIS